MSLKNGFGDCKRAASGSAIGTVALEPTARVISVNETALTANQDVPYCNISIPYVIRLDVTF